MSEPADTPGTLESRVDVVIVAHNAGALLHAAVASAAAQAGEDHVWVMDAESTDDAVAQASAAFPAAHTSRVVNAGFSASNNRGIEAGSAEFVLLLNPDAELAPGALDALLATADAHPRAGIIGAAVLNPDGSAQAGSFGRFPTLATTLGLRVRRLAEKLSGNRTHSPKLPAATTAVDWVTGALMLVRRSAIEDAGAMDEGFFLYYEDIEWCHRMRDHGWEVLLEPSARVTHHLGGAAADGSFVARAYRESFLRYCDLYGLWALKAFSRAGLALRRAAGGRG